MEEFPTFENCLNICNIKFISTYVVIFSFESIKEPIISIHKDTYLGVNILPQSRL